MSDEKKTFEKPDEKTTLSESLVTDMKEDMEEYFEEQMVYIRQ